MNIDYQAYRPAIVYLNGAYWGIHNIREKHNEHYPATNHGVDKNNLDLCEVHAQYKGGILASSGDKVKVMELFNYIGKHPMDNESDFEYIESQVDVNEYKNYLISEIYYGNSDWPGNNQKFWRERTENGRWRWILFDVEAGFSQLNQNPFTKGSEVQFKLLKYDQFRSSFLQGMAVHLNSTFSEKRVIAVIDSISNILAPEIPREVKRWQGSLEGWEKYIENLRSYAKLRPQVLRRILINQFDVEGVVNLTFKSTNKGGEILVETVSINESAGVYFKGVPLKLEAKPAAGYKFVRWTGIPGIESSFTHTPTKDTEINAVFEAIK